MPSRPDQFVSTVAAGLLLLLVAATHAGQVEVIDVGEAASRIQQHSARPSVVLLYGAGCRLSRQLFPAFVALAREYRDRPVDFLVFSTDGEEKAYRVPSFLEQNGAWFPPVLIRPWAPGNLDRALSPLGIQVGATWTRPLVAIRGSQGWVVAQGQGVTGIAFVREALERVTR